MRHLLILLISIILLSSPLFGQTERPETIVIPVGTLGDISASRKQIIQNTLSQELTKYFRLVPQDKFEEAQDQAFEELEYEECTEDQCIMMIQEILQVENVFSLQLVAEDGDTQLSLTWVGLDEKKVLTDFCEECKTKELNSKIELLVKNMVQQIGQVTKVDAEPKEKLDDTTESYTYKLRGIIGSGSSDKTEFSNMSLHFVWDWLGIGLSDFYMESTSSAGQKYELHNQSLDLSYTYADDYSFSFGVGVIVDGEAKSSTLNLKSTAVSGYRVMGLMGTDLGKWEFLGGYQYSTFEYKNFTSTKNFNMSGGLMVFGIGVGF
ncbi:MAG: hypothetical protein HN472_15755 [Nitrospina sp.]|nr:hypothetical protein [Nitrospina sp.]